MRRCGMLLPVASLPSQYGIGAFSKEAYEFVDQLKEGGQQVWQILPLGPTGFGDSPYQAFSAFAGDPYFIDLETLVKEGLLTEKECDEADFGSDPADIDYGKLYENRFPLLKKAYERWKSSVFSDIDQEERLTAVHKRAEDLLRPETREYCLYMALKDSFHSQSWELWDEEIRTRSPQALERCKELLSDEIGFYEFQQIKFEEQWKKLKAYANSQGIQIMGDIPIYVAFDGADSWAHPELFQFDEDFRPKAVAGCPPDAFSATGQLWGNPLYNWEYHRQTGYQWWMRRMEYSFSLYDVVRVDHFRGFDEYYSIPYGHDTAEKGSWEKGPGIDIFRKMEEHFGTEHLPIVAEDLGFLTPSVHRLLKETGFPGMKVLEFAFAEGGSSPYLPHNYTANCVVYTGTHDNDTLAGWYRNMGIEEKEFSIDYLGNSMTPPDLIHWDFIRLALGSVADLAVIPVQDYLGLESEARTNEPSTIGKNWRWRLQKGQLDDKTLHRCKKLAEVYGRA